VAAKPLYRSGRVTVTDRSKDNFLRAGPVLVNRDYINLLTQLPVRNIREAMTADLGERLDKPGLQCWRRRDRLRVQNLMGQERVLYLKRFVLPPLKAQIERMLSGSLWHGTAWVEWKNIRRLNALGVPTMRAAVYAEKMAGPWELGSLLCTDQVPGESLEKWLPRCWETIARVRGLGWRRQVIEQLARIVRRLHDSRLCHRDLYTCHVFVDVDQEGGTRFSLIDLQRMIRPILRRRRWWIKDLAALAASAPTDCITRTDRLRFLLAYLRQDNLDPRARRWWYDVQAKAARMMRHHETRMKRLAEKASAAN